MQQIVSRVLIFGVQSRQRNGAVSALSRCAVETIEAADIMQAREIITSPTDELPGLAVMHPDYESEAGPLAFYNELRKYPASRDLPVLILVETHLERTALQTMNLKRCTCCLTPFSHAALVFALPSLGLGIRDSVLFQQSAQGEVQPGFLVHS